MAVFLPPGCFKHELKSWPREFAAVAAGEKTFEIRKDDRSPRFQRNDFVVLREFEPAGQRYTGRSLLVQIGYVERSPCIPAGWCGFAVRQ